MGPSGHQIPQNKVIGQVWRTKTKMVDQQPLGTVQEDVFLSRIVTWEVIFPKRGWKVWMCDSTSQFGAGLVILTVFWGPTLCHHVGGSSEVF